MKDIYSMSLEELRAAEKQLENAIQEVNRLIRVLKLRDGFEEHSGESTKMNKRKARK